MKFSLSRHTKVFISYSHKDARYLERLQIHLADFSRRGIVDIWSDQKITPGAVWQAEIEQAIATASVAVLLVSADFLASQFIAEKELPQLLSAASAMGTVVLPVILSPCQYEFSALSPFQAVNKPSFPLSKMTYHQKEDVWKQVVETIRKNRFSQNPSYSGESKLPDISITRKETPILTTFTADGLEENKQKREDHTKELLEATPSQGAGKAAYPLGQQQLAIDLAAEVHTSWVLERKQNASHNAILPRPSLFTGGLCAGHVFQSSSSHYFVSHGFDADTLTDWRATIVDAITQARTTSTPLTPYFAGDTILSGFQLCSICEKLYSADFCLFLLPAMENHNVYLELGITIGLGKPFLLIQERDAHIPPFLEGLGLYTRRGSFVTMRRELAGQVKEYNFGAVRFIQQNSILPTLHQYFIGAGEQLDDEDFVWSVVQSIDAAYPDRLEDIALSSLTKNGYEPGSLLKQLVQTLQTTHFALYRVDEHSSPATFLALGISIGLSKPFLMIRRTGKAVPFDLRGIALYEFANFVMLTRDLVTINRSFFARHI